MKNPCRHYSTSALLPTKVLTSLGAFRATIWPAIPGTFRIPVELLEASPDRHQIEAWSSGEQIGCLYLYTVDAIVLDREQLIATFAEFSHRRQNIWVKCGMSGRRYLEDDTVNDAVS